VPSLRASIALVQDRNLLTVAAVVVSYNRLELLRKCLVGLLQQDRKADEVIVIDNGSTDGSPDMVREEFPTVVLFGTGKNLGGAGGFAWGIELAVARGHDAAWLMDDDAEPLPGSLRPLVAALESDGDRPAFAASLVVNSDGNPDPGHLPNVDLDPARQLEAAAFNGIAVKSATFVGVLVDLERSRNQPLPYPDFFIWFDDKEYTTRLAFQGLGVLIPESRILHPHKGQQKDMGARLFYFVRNSLWLSKLSPQEHSIALVRRAIGMMYLICREGVIAKDKRLWALSSFRALQQGLLTTPERVMPGELLSRHAELNR
jgi:rhamnopyranosyl-N-acetylglucosaminyl-diphospho-decaprenol beta-1,3/1,4-galactofuranosyltransferase